MRRFSIIVGLLVAFLLGVVAVGWVALQSIDWNDYKAPISQAAFDNTGRQLDLAGDLSLEIGLTPGVRIASVGFQNAEWGSREDMVTLEELVVRLELLPLLSGDVVVDRVDLIGLDVLLETNADGVANWSFEPPEPSDATDDTAGAPPVDSPTDSDDPAADPVTTLLRSAWIENAKIVVRDQATGAEQRVEVAKLLAETGEARGPLSLELEASYADSPITAAGEVTGLPDLLGGGPLGLDLEISAGGGSIEVKGTVSEPLEAPVLDLDLRLEGDSLAGFDPIAGSALPDLGPYRVALKVAGGGDRFAVSGLDLQVGESRLLGDVTLGLAGVRPRIDAKLTSPLLDAADFQGSSGAAEAGERRDATAPPVTPATAPETAPARVFSPDPLPLDRLDALDADITLAAAQIRSGDLVLSGTELRLQLKDRKLRIDPLTTQIAGGRTTASATLDGSRKSPPVSLSAHVRGLVLGDLMAAQGSDVLSDGPVDLDVDVSGAGASVRQIMAGLGGSLDLRMGPGTVNDEWAALAVSDVSSLVASASEERGARIGCVLADLRIREGVVRPDGLVVDLGSVALFGDGKIDLRDERIKLRFDRQSYSASAGKVLPPFEVKGTLAEPKPVVDASAAAGHVLDLAASILGKDEDDAGSAPRPVGCDALLASYREAGKKPAQQADVATKAADLIGGKTGKKAKKVVEGLQGLLGR